MKKLLIKLIRFYQRRISPAYPRRCRFEPTCSEYAAQAIGRYGALRGGALAARRLCRCQPFSKRDYFDPVPERPSTQKRDPFRGRRSRPDHISVWENTQ